MRPPIRVASRAPVSSSRPAMPTEMKTMSILNKARMAMEESFSHNDEDVQLNYESPSYPSRFPSSSKPKYFPSYGDEPEYYRESSSSYGKYAESSSLPTHWSKSRSAPSSSHLASETRYRATPYNRMSKETE